MKLEANGRIIYADGEVFGITNSIEVSRMLVDSVLAITNLRAYLEGWPSEAKFTAEDILKAIGDG